MCQNVNLFLKLEFKILIVFSHIFVVDQKIIHNKNFVATLKTTEMPKCQFHVQGYKDHVKFSIFMHFGPSEISTERLKIVNPFHPNLLHRFLIGVLNTPLELINNFPC